TSPNYDDHFLPGAASVSYLVTVTDTLGNESPASGPARVTTPTSWNAPTPQVAIVAPTDAQALAMVRGSTLVTATATGRGIAQLAFDSAPAGSANWTGLPSAFPVAPWTAGGPSAGPLPLATWGAIWNTSQLSGSYDLRVTVTDTAGRSAEQVRTITFCGACP